MLWLNVKWYVSILPMSLIQEVTRSLRLNDLCGSLSTSEERLHHVHLGPYKAKLIH